MASTEVNAVTRLARDHSGQVLASLAKRFGDLDLADDAVQEALIEATEHWPTNGVPSNPAGWLYRVAQRKAVDQLRRQGAEGRRFERAAADIAVRQEGDLEADDSEPLLIDDEAFDAGDAQLRLILLCCHPALAVDAQVALTLRLVGGLTTDEIAAAFLVSTPTMAARVTRAKKKIRAANIPLAMPNSLDERIDAVLTVLYLIFNEGYLSHSQASSPMRVDLCDEAIRLARVITAQAPQHAEALGLLALLLFTHARRDARFDDETLVLLDDQDRSLWSRSDINEANQMLSQALPLMAPGRFQLEAIIAAHHSNAATASDTNWSRIVALYDQLIAMRPSPVAEVNRAVSIAMAEGPDAGLAALDLVVGLDDYRLLHAARAELLALNGDRAGARTSFELALALATNSSERSHLERRLSDLAS